MAQLSDFQNKWTRGARPLSGECNNAQPGTFGHECGKPATWVGTIASVATTDGVFHGCFCDDCKERGWEAREVKVWTPITRGEA